MTVYMVVSNDKVVQVFWSVYPPDAKQAAEDLVRELTKKWAIARVVEQQVTVV